MVWCGVIVFAVFVMLFGQRVAKKYGVLDRPGADQTRTRRVPTLQGVWVILGVFAVMGIFRPELRSQRAVQGFGIGALLLGMVTLRDDRAYYHPELKSPGPLLRLLTQVVVALIALFRGWVWVETLTRQGHDILIPLWIGVPFVIARFVLTINALNRFDGVSGNTSGISTIGFVTIASLIQWIVLPAFPDISPDTALTLTTTATLARVMSIFCLLATIIETKPRGLMRDTGTMFMGFALAYLSLMGGTKVGIVLVVLSLALFDAIRVLARRMIKLRKNPLKGDYTHLHHRLLANGRTRGEVRGFVWIRSVFLSVIMLLQDTDRVNKLVIFGMLFLIFFGVNWYVFWVKGLPSELKKGDKPK